MNEIILPTNGNFAIVFYSNGQWHLNFSASAGYQRITTATFSSPRKTNVLMRALKSLGATNTQIIFYNKKNKLENPSYSDKWDRTRPQTV